MPKITKHKFDASGTELKRCSKCKVFIPIGGFSKQKAKWDGLQSACKECCALEIRRYQEKNKVKLAAKAREYRKKNKAKVKAIQRKYRENNKKEINARERKWREKNKEIIAAKQRKYREDNKEIMTFKKRIYLQRKDVKERANKRSRERRKEDPLYRLTLNMRCALHKSLKSAQLKKNNRTFKYISCSPSFLLDRLERQRKERGLDEDYHIDHMLPIDSFDLKDAEELRRCWHWSNLQSLDPEDNLRKSNNIIYDMRWHEKRDEYWIRNKDNKGPYRPTALFQSLLLV